MEPFVCNLWLYPSLFIRSSFPLEGVKKHPESANGLSRMNVIKALKLHTGALSQA